MAVFTLEDEQIVWKDKSSGNLSVWCEFMSHCRRPIRLDGQIVWEKSSFQTICSSSSVKTAIVSLVILQVLTDYNNYCNYKKFTRQVPFNGSTQETMRWENTSPCPIKSFSIYFKLRATIFRFVPMAARPMVRGSDVIVKKRNLRRLFVDGNFFHSFQNQSFQIHRQTWCLLQTPFSQSRTAKRSITSSRHYNWPIRRLS